MASASLAVQIFFITASCLNKQTFQVYRMQSVCLLLWELQDFEVAIRALDSGAGQLLNVYDENQAGLSGAIRADAAALKDLLVQTVAKTTQTSRWISLTKKVWACRRFLSNFLSGRTTGTSCHVELRSASLLDAYA